MIRAGVMQLTLNFLLFLPYPRSTTMGLKILFRIFLVIMCSSECIYAFNESLSQESKDACGAHGVCHCSRLKYSKFEVDCYGNIHNIPSNIPANTSVLLIQNTPLRDIPANAFSGLSNLQNLTLSYNSIDHLHDASFHGITNTAILSLNYNNLRILPEKVFEGLPLLVLLNVESSYLKTIPRNGFRQLPELMQLAFGNNSIDMLHPGTFRNLSKLEILKLDYNKINLIQEGTFEGLLKVNLLYLSNNELKTLSKNVFKELVLLEYLELSYNMLTDIQVGCFEGLQSLRVLFLNRNKLRSLSARLFEGLSSLEKLNLKDNQITILQEGNFVGLSSLYQLNLSCNSISTIGNGSFHGLQNLHLIDLSANNISQIIPGTFNHTDVFYLETLFLQRNKLTIIHRDAFIGLDMLMFLCLYSNQIHQIEDDVFFLRNLRYIYLFQNNLTDITGNPFRSKVMEQLHLYGNEIRTFGPESLTTIPAKANIYISCDSLFSLPINTNHDRIQCVNPLSLPSINQSNVIVNTLKIDGFNCTRSQIIDRYTCKPCEPGTYGDTLLGGCHSCPVGGFFQDEIAQTKPSQPNWKIACKLCNEGTYVKAGHGISAKDCEVCPEGTNQSIAAGYRACYCKKNYARNSRYGPCYICLEEGLDCKQEFQTLLPGYMWDWKIPNANLTDYKKFVENLQVENDSVATHTNYTGEMPRIFECPRTESCPNNNDSITGNCAKGYTGWLCTNCEPNFYSVLTSCVPCPSKAILAIESFVFFFVCVLICFLLSWQIKRKTEKEMDTRSFIDVLIARVKILLGFYQVIGEIFISLHDVNWTGPLVIMGKLISAFEINIVRQFVRPRCINDKLDLNPKIQFIIGATSPVVIFLIPFLYYQAKKLYVYIRFTLAFRLSFRSHFENLKACFFACVIVLWFVIYPPVCSVIFSLYPLSCKTFPLNHDKTYNITRLRSDFDVDCTGLRAYHISAFILTAAYVIAFPAGLLLVLCKYHLRSSTDESCGTDDPSFGNDDSTTASLNINSANHLPTTTTTPPPPWLNFLSENYKTKFWYWEIVELSRKVTQTLLITLFGWEDRLTVIITTCISVLFLLLHARYRPMKSSYEQGLQMFSLTVIFINVIVAPNGFPEEHDDSISVILVILNVIVLVIIAGELLVTIVVHIKHFGIISFVVVSIRRLRASAMSKSD
ncbi:uncharacterized protein [Apostichopus japonicus]|uniref:uncharacterized protein isoform X2 n=1 Tax=Stichopus japonicus TaxID=307972 RepID=UPI003AB62E06